MVDNALIAEILSCAYASHVAACEAAEKPPISADRFFDIYKDKIADFRRLLYVVDENNPCG